MQTIDNNQVSSETTTSNARTYLVRVENKSSVEEKLVALQRRAVKLGVPGFSWTWGEQRKCYPQTYTMSGFVSDYDIEASKPYIGINLEIIGAQNIGVEGWRMVGALEHTDSGTLIYSTTSEPFPAQYKNCKPQCDHCGHNRNRNWTYILQDESGTYKQVGSTCLKDFTHHSADSIASYGEFLKDMKEALDESLFCKGKGWTPIEDFLAEIASLISQWGWTPKSAAYEGQCPTVERWLNCVVSHTPIQVSDDNRKGAKVALTWAQTLQESECMRSDYLHNIHTISKNLYVEPRHEGLAASIIAAYNRAQEIESKKSNLANSVHVGTVGKRQSFELTLERKFSYDGQYGTTYKLIFKDVLGNKVVWSTSNGHGVEEGKTYSLLGTVKAHSEYRGVSQTEITRCKMQ